MCNELIEETAGHRKLILACESFSAMAPVSSELRRKCRLIMELLSDFYKLSNTFIRA